MFKSPFHLNVDSSKVCEVRGKAGTNRSTEISGRQLRLRPPTITIDDSGLDMASIADEEEAPAQTAKDPPTGCLPRPPAPTITTDDNMLDMAGLWTKRRSLRSQPKGRQRDDGVHDGTVLIMLFHLGTTLLWLA